MKHKVLINPDTPEIIKTALAKNDFEVINIPYCEALDRPIAGHPDLQFFIHADIIFCPERTPLNFIKYLEQAGCQIILCESEPKEKYPHDIPYNVACTGNIAFHRTDKTEMRILAYLKEQNIPIYNVAQGYSRCSTVIVSESHIITADSGIHNAALGANIEGLLITSGHVALLGYKYGFIGGASGTYEDKVYFTGNINKHPNGRSISEFIEQAGKEVICLTNDELLDTGSLLFF